MPDRLNFFWLAVNRRSNKCPDIEGLKEVTEEALSQLKFVSGGVRLSPVSTKKFVPERNER